MKKPVLKQAVKVDKKSREKAVLLALVELYLKTGKPIGSSALLNEDLPGDISSATVRNYFAKLEEEGFLEQLHTSGGRVPTSRAYRFYVDNLEKPDFHPQINELQALSKETRALASFLEGAAEQLSELSGCAVFLSSPRFDHDFVTKIQLVDLGDLRTLCVILTDFGLVHTEVLRAPRKLSAFTIKRIESYFHWKLTKNNMPPLSQEEAQIGESLYNELMLRHIASYGNFGAEDICKTGFSKLLAYPEFTQAASLASALSLFENEQSLSYLIEKTMQNSESISCWIGDELSQMVPPDSGCSVLAIPYKINQTVVGTIALLGPTRMPYKSLFALLSEASERISQSLTKSVHKFKITYRKPDPSGVAFTTGELEGAETLLLENHSL